MTSLQSKFLALHKQEPAFVSAVQLGTFYAVATEISIGSYTLAVTELDDGTLFPVLHASQKDAEDALNQEIKEHRNITKADNDDDDDDDDSDDELDLIVVEVQWTGGEDFVIEGRATSLFKIQRGLR